ncbi:MAG: acylphosphatase, partial [Arcobacteraceae bacterium]|nr:acylphosphatase [Arcobacteraceae bacterium]
MIETHIKIKGIVQGVGFRPYVYNLALELDLKGFVNNDESGVNIVLQGDEKRINSFIKTVQNTPPPLAKIEKLS